MNPYWFFGLALTGISFFVSLKHPGFGRDLAVAGLAVSLVGLAEVIK